MKWSECWIQMIQKKIFLGSIFNVFFGTTQLSAHTELPYFDKNDLTPFWENNQKNDHAAVVTQFAAIDQNGVQVSEKNLTHSISIVNFFFTSCPNLCPLMMTSLQNFQKNLGPLRERIHIFSFSVQPDRDSSGVLKKFADTHRLDQNHWQLLTGQRSIIYEIGKNVFKADGSVGSQRNESSFIHTQNVYLVDEKRHIRGIYNSENSKDMSELLKDVNILASSKRSELEIKTEI